MSKNTTKKKGRRGASIAVAIICFFLAICIGLFAVGFVYLRSLYNAVPEIEDTMVYDFDEDETLPDSLQDDPEFETIYEGDATELKESIKEWATNDANIMYSNDVINVLCIGVDTRNKDAIAGLTDSMIIASVNTKLGTISFSSIMRDSYAYLESPGGVGSYNKINAAFPFYGVENLVDTIESHFKIRIDGYAMINFAFFKAAIDKLGGVTVAVQEYEAAYINKVYDFDVVAGSAVTLSGDEALGFCRSRKCDSDGDISRTRRQRDVLTGVLKKAATIQASEVPDYVKTFLPYLETSYTEAEVLSLATKAVVGGWANFKVQQMVVPDETSRVAHDGDMWYWEVDYPRAAKNLQEFIYGESIIQLNEE